MLILQRYIKNFNMYLKLNNNNSTHISIIIKICPIYSFINIEILFVEMNQSDGKYI